eukprot:COSAG02_NODE_127_length_34879_cov_12.705060_14_plen_93_part_00
MRMMWLRRRLPHAPLPYHHASPRSRVVETARTVVRRAGRAQPDDREQMQTDEREFMMVTLVIGNTVEMDRDRDEAMRVARDFKFAIKRVLCE